MGRVGLGVRASKASATAGATAASRPRRDEPRASTSLRPLRRGCRRSSATARFLASRRATNRAHRTRERSTRTAVPRPRTSCTADRRALGARAALAGDPASRRAARASCAEARARFLRRLWESARTEASHGAAWDRLAAEFPWVARCARGARSTSGPRRIVAHEAESTGRPPQILHPARSPRLFARPTAAARLFAPNCPWAPAVAGA